MDAESQLQWAVLAYTRATVHTCTPTLKPNEMAQQVKRSIPTTHTVRRGSQFLSSDFTHTDHG